MRFELLYIDDDRASVVLNTKSVKDRWGSDINITHASGFHEAEKHILSRYPCDLIVSDFSYRGAQTDEAGGAEIYGLAHQEAFLTPFYFLCCTPKDIIFHEIKQQFGQKVLEDVCFDRRYHSLADVVDAAVENELQIDPTLTSRRLKPAVLAFN